jgi:hypothetical protein
MIAQCIEIPNWHHKQAKPSQKKTAAHFDSVYPNLRIKQPLVSSWLKDESVWHQRWAETQGKGQAHDAKRVKQVEQPEIEEMMELWIAKAMRDRVHVSGEIIRQKWTHFADLVGVPLEDWLQLSDCWLTALKKCTGLKSFKRHGEAASANEADIAEERLRIQKIILHETYELRDVFNMDEMGLFWV